MTMIKHPSRVRTLGFALALGGALLAAPLAYAGEVKFGSAPLEVDDAGKLTAAGKAAAVKQLPSSPGEEVWPLHVWAQIDKGAPGPLYVEFFDKLPGSGKRYRAWQYEHSTYQGEKYVTLEIELEGDVGFNKGHTYTVEISQLDNKNKNLVLASGQIELVYTEGKKEDEEDDGEEKDEEGEEGEEGDAQDELDSFAEGGDGGAGGETPPPVTSPTKKKGCSIEPGMGAAPGVLVLLLLGAGLARPRRRR
jgi:MYXO-CTERM domain-containing protein